MGFGGVSFRLVGQRGPEATATVDRTRWPDDAALIAAIEAFAGPLSTFEGTPVQQGETPENPTTTPMGAAGCRRNLASQGAAPHPRRSGCTDHPATDDRHAPNQIAPNWDTGGRSYATILRSPDGRRTGTALSRCADPDHRTGVNPAHGFCRHHPESARDKGMALCQGPMSDADHARMVEFCCPQCFASVMGRDDDPIPKCARCRIKMLPDSDEPKCRPPSTILGRMRGNPAYGPGPRSTLATPQPGGAGWRATCKPNKANT